MRGEESERIRGQSLRQPWLFGSSAEERFNRFHRENPHVYDELRELCLQVHRAGERRFGIRTIWERLRWKARFETIRPSSDYKLNDHYTRFYARLLMEQEPELAGMFETRTRGRNGREGHA